MRRRWPGRTPAALRRALTIFAGLGASAAVQLTPAQDARAEHPVDPGRAADRDPGRSG
jgi:hypothetical protein